ncbi:MAG: metalloregulator ArsR/SmtB family transcription factor [Anaerolineales bacterium]
MNKPFAPNSLNENLASRLAELFRTLGDPSRVRIIAALLEGETNVGDLAEAVALSPSAVSHQLRSLRQMRLVRTRKEGREVYYALDDDHVAELFQRGLDHVLHG